MALKDDVPAFPEGLPNLGLELRALAAVVVAQCEAIEGLQESLAALEAAAATKPASKPATKAAEK